MRVVHIKVLDSTWDMGYYNFVWSPPVKVMDVPEQWNPDVEIQRIAWPLPLHRVYEVVVIGDTTHVLLRASAFQHNPAIIRIPEEG